MGRIEYKNWRKAVYERDNYTCQFCGKRGDLNADHIKPLYTNPELAYDVNNGRTLCVECHKKTDTWGRKVKTRYICEEIN
jgi:5-methylcytosine-specific restriction endonuclease McrA